MLKRDWPSRLLVAATSGGLVLTLLGAYGTFLFPTNDDFYSDPGHLYVKDARWVVIPFLTSVDGFFDYQHLSKPLALVVLALAGSTLSLQLARLFSLARFRAIILSGFVGLAIAAMPNLMWGPGLWYSASAIIGVSVAAGGLSMARNNRYKGRVGEFIWGLGVVWTFFSYQPLAIFALLLWVIAVPVGGMNEGLKKAGQIFKGPLVASLTILAVVLLLNYLFPSARLEGSLSPSSSVSFQLSTLTASYGRPAQALLIVLLVALGIQLLAISFATKKKILEEDLLLLIFLFVVIAIPPLLMKDASGERFATTVLISALMVLASRLVSVWPFSHDISSQYVFAFGVFGPGIVLLGGLTLLGLGQWQSASGVFLAVFVSLTLAYTMSLVFRKGLPELLIWSTTAALLLVSGAVVRGQLFENSLANSLDEEVASEIVLEVASLELDSSQVIDVFYEVEGEPGWYSPLSHVGLGGVEVLKLRLATLNSYDFEVSVSEGRCSQRKDIFSNRSVSKLGPDSVLVCLDY